MTARRGRLVAVAVSAALHAAIAGVVLNASWTRVARAPSAPIDVVWIERWPLPSEPETTVSPLPQDEPETRDVEPASEPPDVAPSEDELPDAPPSEVRARAPDDASVEDAVEETPVEERASPEEARGRPSRAYTVREVDLDEAWRAALEQTREERRRQEVYRSFSLDDLLPEPVPPEDPTRPEESVFETAKRADRPPSALSPGKARSRLGQRLARLCNELTGGGFSVLGLASLCADEEALPKLFAHLKPEYLRARPECTEVDAPSPIDGEGAAVKCRLVLDEEPTLD
ncbi:MAG: hypothetical protein LOD94_01180 [Gammaproteobacteria bacterium]|nr:hypothetical protein [Gammaproteobacteria bacterium]